MLNRLVSIYRKIFWSYEKNARYQGVKIGKSCSIMTTNFGSEPYLVEIGDHCQITTDVKFFTHGAAWVFRKKYPKIDFFGKIKIGNNVYIGNNALILPGVKVEDNVIIAAGAVVTKSIPEDSIVGGNPAKVIGKVSELEAKILPYNLDVKGLNYEEKKQHLLNESSEKFLTK